MQTVTPSLHRLRLDKSRPYQTRPILYLWRGSTLRVQLGLADGAALLSVANLASLTYEIKPYEGKNPPTENTPPLYARTVDVFDDTLTEDTWATGAKQHVAFDLDKAATQFPANTYRLIISALTIDNPSQLITFLVTDMQVREDGGGLASVIEQTPDVNYYTADQTDAQIQHAGQALRDEAAELLAQTQEAAEGIEAAGAAADRAEAAATATDEDRTAVTGILAEVEGKRQEVADNTAAVAADKTAVEGIAAEVETKRQEVAANTAAVAGDKAAVEGIAAEVEAKRQEVATNTASVAGNKTAVEGIAAEVETKRQEVAANTVTVAGDKTAVAGMLTEVEGKRQEVADNTAAVAADKDASALSATNAEAARLATEAGLADFAQRYLGPYAEAPAAPAEGSPLYYNTTTGKLQVWSGSAWASPVEGMAQAEADVRYALKAEAAKAFGAALYLDGSTGYISLPSKVTPVIARSHTIAMLVRFVDGVVAATRVFMGASSAGLGYFLRPTYTGALRAEISDGVTSVQVETAAIILSDGPAVDWRWVVFAVDLDAGTATWIIDGVDVGPHTDISAIDFAAIASGLGSYPLFWGGRNSAGSPTSYVAAHLDRLTVFNRALSTAEGAARFGPQPTAPIVPTIDRWGVPDENLFTNPDFESYTSGGFAGWTSFVQGTSTIDADEVDMYAGARAARFNIDAANSYAELITSANVVTAGVRYRATFWAKGTAGSNLSLYNGGSSMGFVTLTETWARYAIEFTATDTGKISFRRSGSVAPRTMLLDEARLQRIGAVASYSATYDARVGYQLHDASSNNLHALISASGCTWLEVGTNGLLTLSGFTADAWLGGSERPLLPAGYRITEIIAIETAGVAVSNLALGTTANGTDLVSSFSLLAGETKALTVAAPFAAKSAPKPIHINDAPGGPWGGASVSLTFILEKL